MKEGSSPQMSQSFLLFFHNFLRTLRLVLSICMHPLFTYLCFFFQLFFFIPNPVIAPKHH